ncbi:4-hydroxyphenylacetate catabolism regulatory protein HpaA [Acinetobacter bouvetii]|jgi:AraC family 4-hydroxyphenylacetate 3-monooxygenase operon regulatory protein|uniref:4-hydroxyphenylacetate catabolism regulatory protein HpaA n=1 Tax=Acinetobacter bouvetii TaxID=202951 RepID=A0A4V2DNV7_9GAMM|nr:4-hydroxyphenylacetate catabolism regulatory protein HpaA [Acinetobacter bouvetii]QXW24886.1 4-hydroxyphenylacetate catabolism regulatory protein HpaA [Acinetobacter johnsonii]RZG64446.1 4-hydroxyphenylacetate catabolism regulatory protein HpaA [Acinetobacter bouvetii]
MNHMQIPNIKLGEVYDQRYMNSEIHYDAQGKLADFFGVNMPAHRHDGFFQIHFFTKGSIRIFLDDVKYVCKAPVCFLTPPSVAHAFITDPMCEGHVLTVQQNLVWPLLQVDLKVQNIVPLCISLDGLKNKNTDDLMQLERYFDDLQREFQSNKPNRQTALRSLVSLIFIQLIRLGDVTAPRINSCSGDLSTFRSFNELIENHFLEHWPLHEYAQALNVTETRLNDICRRVADISSKKLIFDRQMQEAKRLLIFSDSTINTVCYQLGFKDPAYFSRFFTRHAGVRPSDYRSTHMNTVRM